MPRRRTFAAGIMPAAHSMLTALRHPCLRWSATPATGHGQPLAIISLPATKPPVREWATML
ncbi:MAG: hypothetical protein ACKOC8_08085, partial [Pirellulales bacterium]